MKNEQKIKDCWDKLVLEYDVKNNQKWFWSNPVVWAVEILKTELKIINADAHHIPFKDDNFDVVICRYAIWPLSDPQCAIEEDIGENQCNLVLRRRAKHL